MPSTLSESPTSRGKGSSTVQTDHRPVQEKMAADVRASALRVRQRRMTAAAEIHARTTEGLRVQMVTARERRRDGRACALSGGGSGQGAIDRNDCTPPAASAVWSATMKGRLWHHASSSSSPIAPIATSPHPPAASLVPSCRRTIPFALPRCQLGRDVVNHSIDMVIVEHLERMRLLAHNVGLDEGFLGMEVNEVLDALLADLSTHAGDDALRELLQLARTLVDAISLTPSAEGARRPLRHRLKTLEGENAALRDQLAETELRLQRLSIVHQSVVESPIGGDGRKALLQRVEGTATKSAAAAGVAVGTSRPPSSPSRDATHHSSGGTPLPVTAHLVESLLAENKQVRYELRGIRKELRDSKAEALHYRKQAEELQASLTAALGKMHGVRAGRSAGASQLEDPAFLASSHAAPNGLGKPQSELSIAMLVHESNTAIARVLALPFNLDAAVGAFQGVAPDAEGATPLVENLQPSAESPTARSL